MSKYRKLPVEIEAFRIGIDYIPDWFMNKVSSNDIILHGKSSGFNHYDDTNCDIKTLEGTMHANYGDYIIKGINGEIYPCKPNIFEKTYELVAEEDQSMENEIKVGEYGITNLDSEGYYVVKLKDGNILKGLDTEELTEWIENRGKNIKE